jgi:predicted PurR-regulated permease PerM
MDKFKFDKKYIKISLYVVLTVFLIRIIDSILGAIPDVSLGVITLISDTLSILSPIILGFIIAYLLSAPVQALENFFHKKCHIKRTGLCRAFGIIITYFVVLAVIFGIIFGIFSMVGGQIARSSGWFSIISDYIKGSIGSGPDLTAKIEELDIPFADILAPRITELATIIQNFIINLTTGFADWVVSLSSHIFTILISAILSIYVLASKEYFLSIWNRAYYFVFRDRSLGLSIKRGLRVINYTFTNYIHGQLIEACCVAVLCSAVLSLFRVDYAITIGIITGILNLIPYVGATIGVILGGLMGLLTHGIWTAIWVVVCLFGVQQFDANFLCPKIVGNKVGVHPAIILIAITIGGSKWGLLGMLLAVPVTAALINMLKLWFDRNYEAAYEKYEEMEEDLLFPEDAEHTPKGSTIWKRVKRTARSVANMVGDETAQAESEEKASPTGNQATDKEEDNTPSA